MSNAKSVAFVATKMIPPSPPPSGSVGPIHWAREHLFPTPLNALLTLVSIAFVLWLTPEIIRWAFIDAVWKAGSLAECREIARAAGVEGSFACWAVINERFNQFMFGFYPSELYWRPILAFALLLVALAPVLFAHLPRKMLIFSAVYPFLAYWLIWGDSLWAPLSAMAGFAVAYAAFRALSGGVVQLGLAAAAAAAGLAAVLWWLFAASSAAEAMQAVLPLSIEHVESAKLGGFLLALILGVSGIAMSLPLGILLALGRKSDLPVLKGICVAFIEFIRGVPLITLLFVASTLLNYFLPPGTSFDLILRVVIMVTLFAAAYMAEVIRGGLAALPQGQYEAAAALGLDYWKSMRLVILPQALKISIPGIVNTFIGLFKDTTLVSVIGLLDPVGIIAPMRADSNWNGIVWEFYGFVALFFFIFCFGMSRYSMYLEGKLKTDHR
ncbi:amino acid ABC transporter permease [Oceanicella actignis]|uniref:amino acid ABC transporter permease n=1 Tax=Oceanicella actignis TaxID=1189325 RepID=UPI0011E63143|nr:amino acid ABC transporter permease [Oceanicella actignis]TYO88275.1 L-glutamine ABC transporter membrane protein /L-glutamate ABC transporter membrane protein /L-aspartate ABC transporter membrane protein /L-asparagine ABC transporter membrane protein [Oceanicella actignis]